MKKRVIKFLQWWALGSSFALIVVNAPTIPESLAIDLGKQILIVIVLLLFLLIGPSIQPGKLCFLYIGRRYSRFRQAAQSKNNLTIGTIEIFNYFLVLVFSGVFILLMLFFTPEIKEIQWSREQFGRGPGIAAVFSSYIMLSCAAAAASFIVKKLGWMQSLGVLTIAYLTVGLTKLIPSVEFAIGWSVWAISMTSVCTIAIIWLKRWYVGKRNIFFEVWLESTVDDVEPEFKYEMRHSPVRRNVLELIAGVLLAVILLSVWLGAVYPESLIASAIEEFKNIEGIDGAPDFMVYPAIWYGHILEFIHSLGGKHIWFIVCFVLFLSFGSHIRNKWNLTKNWFKGIHGLEK